jgi:hypothetical protein
MAPFLTALSQQPEFGTVEFMRADIEACPVRSPALRWQRPGRLTPARALANRRWA